MKPSDRLEHIILRHPTLHTKFRTLDQGAVSQVEPLLVDVLQEGKSVYNLPFIEEMRRNRQDDMDRLDPGVKRLMNPHTYHVSLTEHLWRLKQDLIRSAKGEGRLS